jgi:hypothetical protein
VTFNVPLLNSHRLLIVEINLCVTEEEAEQQPLLAQDVRLAVVVSVLVMKHDVGR